MSRYTKHNAILHAAELLLREKRIHELTMDEVAQAASVSKGTIYNHFANKDDLLFQMATHGFDALCDMVSDMPREGLFGERLLLLCQHISGFFEERRAIMRMIQEHEGRFGRMDVAMQERWMSHRMMLVDAVASVLRQGVAEGAVRPDMRLEVLANMLLGMLRARGRDYVHAPHERPELEVVVELFLHGAAQVGCSVAREKDAPCCHVNEPARG